MENERKVAVEQGKNFASEYGMKFFETSAKSSTKISDIFITTTRDTINNLNTNKGKIPKGISCNSLSGKVIDNNDGFLKNLISFVPNKLHLLADNVKEVVKTGISKKQESENKSNSKIKDLNINLNQKKANIKSKISSSLDIINNNSFSIISQNDIITKLHNELNQANEKILLQTNIIKDLENKLNSYKRNNTNDNIIKTLSEKIKDKDEK